MSECPGATTGIKIHCHLPLLELFCCLMVDCVQRYFTTLCIIPTSSLNCSLFVWWWTLFKHPCQCHPIKCGENNKYNRKLLWKLKETSKNSCWNCKTIKRKSKDSTAFHKFKGTQIFTNIVYVVDTGKPDCWLLTRQIQIDKLKTWCNCKKIEIRVSVPSLGKP